MELRTQPIKDWLTGLMGGSAAADLASKLILLAVLTLILWFVWLLLNRLMARLLRSIEGLELAALARPDECCGFGGSFAVLEEAVSVQMGRDRLADHARSGADVIASTDVSCSVHLLGLARREGSDPRILHVAEVLNQARKAGAA